MVLTVVVAKNLVCHNSNKEVGSVCVCLVYICNNLVLRILWLSANLMRRHREAISCIVYLQCRFAVISNHAFLQTLLIGHLFLIGIRVKTIACPLLIVFQKWFQLSIKKYTMPTRSTLHSTACFYMVPHCSTNLTSLWLHCYFQLFQQKILSTSYNKSTIYSTTQEPSCIKRGPYYKKHSTICFYM